MRGIPAQWLPRLLRSLATALVAGIAGLIVHSALMLGKDALGILPRFQPYEDFQRLLGVWAGGQIGGVLPYLTGAMVWGFIYARLHDHLPGQSFWVKGLSFALLAWGAMITGFFLLVGHGVFGLRLGYGLWPALLMFPMLATFSVTLGYIHARMRKAIHLDADTNTQREKPPRIGR
ncbi:DUF6789 family protein [Roseinatronobacter bogoriensis]|uniref:Uncharacterized protein n=1 Tax=Roseinatronobacter bogoriensis subsp. barguzinensis TaxID=441209 RepID=A0A2K8KE29_9RHOB|nr:MULTISPECIES: DUF6789 family protein [Rhodobaca]ATX65028.1 hypothetical protein BG454_03600 [Rhodobaca barguzinensis]MBB4208861.1 hypothetical protein [Rhodobaca bogoriensis DSM 18756]TDW37872.1 hypothetical protein LY39_02225 [Rhodobaca barguzinensis]TDY69959.1 hypothetical protein EV660_103355 [Rhodobaca bogoriensis DSM 18756]